MKQVLLKQGGVVVEDVPAPTVDKGTVLVRVYHSCISVGTEMSGVRSSSAPLWKRALSNPIEVRKLYDRVLSDGVLNTRELVRRKLQTAHPIGYSASGVVIAVGEGVDDISVGMHVACAGSQAAYHAEIVCVPRNLVVIVPDEVALDEASTVTLGAIALQGVRRAEPTLGETFIVVGLGIIGQITQQILRANGVHVIGVDVDQDRVKLAEEHGLKYGLTCANDEMITKAYQLSNGYGADGVIITAATSSSEVLSCSFKSCRRKGRVVLVGDVGLNIDRHDIYAKELDFLISTSYGPGRYDRCYEEQGMEYPLPYVRWTENRNMSAFLDLIASKQISLKSMISQRYEVKKAVEAYNALRESTPRPLSILLDYENTNQEIVRTVHLGRRRPLKKGVVRVAVVGAGGFATGTLMPIIKKMPNLYEIARVVTRQGHSATNAARQFDVPEASTDFDAALSDPEIDAVIIATRHDLHGPMVLAALKAGKHVMVEKPLCLKETELDEIEEYFSAYNSANSVLMVGFNRRFSPLVQTIKSELQGRQSPMIINYRVNAGYIPSDHWVHTHEGGGRNIGEACHFYDLFTALIKEKVTEISAHSIEPRTKYYCRSDNFIMNLTYADGSVAHLTYTALGASSHPKEKMTIYSDGKVIELEDYRCLKGYETKFSSVELKHVEKGHREEIEEFAHAIVQGEGTPIPLWEMFQATRVALKVQKAIFTGEEAEL
ncbi:MAG: bi-domain-containing oxidoreductase [Pseudomonadota bacterium]|nr:bi-domain-containing oxidoreductase [Pseudomonadota bacterium]